MRRWFRLSEERWERLFAGHVTLGRLTIFGYNACHILFQYRTHNWGYIIFHPHARCFGCWWPWKFYMSPDGTPGMAYIAFGPGIDRESRRRARMRRVNTDYARWHTADYYFDREGVSRSRQYDPQAEGEEAEG